MPPGPAAVKTKGARPHPGCHPSMRTITNPYFRRRQLRNRKLCRILALVQRCTKNCASATCSANLLAWLDESRTYTCSTSGVDPLQVAVPSPGSRSPSRQNPSRNSAIVRRPHAGRVIRLNLGGQVLAPPLRFRASRSIRLHLRLRRTCIRCQTRLRNPTSPQPSAQSTDA